MIFTTLIKNMLKVFGTKKDHNILQPYDSFSQHTQSDFKDAIKVTKKIYYISTNIKDGIYKWYLHE